MSDEQYLDDDGGSKYDGLVTGLVLATTLALVVGIVLVNMALKEYGKNWF